MGDDVTESEDRPGKRLTGGAWAFLKAAKLLLADDPEVLAWATMFVLLGLALELALKGYLREAGQSEQQQKSYGHDLVAAFKAAHGSGFRPANRLAEGLIEELNPHYKDMSLRYLKGTSLTLPRIQEAILVVEELLLDLHGQASLIRRDF